MGGGFLLIATFLLQEKLDEAAGLVCSDGTIMRIESGGKAVCKVSSDERHFYVYG